MDYLSSMYIDNELNLEDKIQFVDRIHSDTVFYNNTKELIAQEKLLRLPTPTRLLPARPPRPSRTGQWFKSIFKPIGIHCGRVRRRRSAVFQPDDHSTHAAGIGQPFCYL